MRVSRTGRVVQIIESERVDAKERLEALRLQALAWRHLCLIGLVNPKWARGRAQWLFMQSVPYVNGPELRQFVEETKCEAARCGKEAGVFK